MLSIFNLKILGTHIPTSTYTRRYALATLAPLLALIVLSVGASTAQATFTRPFLREITRAEAPSTKPCSEAEVKNPGLPCGFADPALAVDEKDDLWSASFLLSTISEFEPAYAAVPNEFLKTSALAEHEQKLIQPDGVAIEHSSPERFYVAGGPVIDVFDSTGAFVEQWPEFFDRPEIAVDNSTDEMEDESACGTGPLAFTGECFHYVTRQGGEPGGLEKFNSKGDPEPFKCKTTECAKYIQGNRITGVPGNPYVYLATKDGKQAVAVDSKGDIYAGNGAEAVVYEFLPSGEFRQTFAPRGEEVPQIGHGAEGIEGIAVDPVSKHLVVTIASETGSTREGGVDEFDLETGKFVAQITGVPGGAPLQRLGGPVVDSHGDVYVPDEIFETYMEGSVERIRAKESIVDVWGPGAYYPTVALGTAGKRTSDTAELTGSVNPAQQANLQQYGQAAPVIECVFQYVEEAVFNESVAHKEAGFAKAGPPAPCEHPDAAEIPTEKLGEVEQAVAVHATVTGLKEGTPYRYRLVAGTESAKRGGKAETVSRAFTAPALPGVVPSAAANVSSTFADLHAQIDPDGAQTSYRFEYDTRAYTVGEGAHGVSVPVPDAVIGSGGATGSSLESVLQHVGPLVPGTTYHFRVVATNEIGTKDGPDQVFTTLPEVAAGLPDGRSYELVTPADKEGGSDMFAEKETNGEFANSESVGTPSSLGDGFLLETRSAFGAFPSAFFNMYVFRRVRNSRGELEWSYQSLSSPSLGVQSIGGSGVASKSKVVFDPADLSRVGFVDGVGSEESEEGTRTFDLLGAPGGPYTTLHVDPPFHQGEGSANRVETWVLGASHDLNHVILESNSDSACPEPNGAGLKVQEGDVLCEWSGGELSLVNLAPGSESAPASTCGAILGGGEIAGTEQRAVSADGSVVFFTAPRPIGRGIAAVNGPGCPGAGHPSQLYARVAVKQPAGEVLHQTLKVSAPEPAAGPQSEYPVQYVGSSEDGSKVFFVTEGWLTADHPQVHDRELYECEITIEEEQPACKLTRVSAGEPGGKEGAQVFTVPAVAAEGTAVYFTANGVLASNQGAGGAHASPDNCERVGGNETGGCNLYRYDTVTQRTSYVATVAGEDYDDQGQCGDGAVIENIGPCSKADWYTTPDGEYLLFGSSLPIEGYNDVPDNCTEALPFEQSQAKGSCSELYRYDAQAAEAGEQALVCVSCGPGGADAAGNAEFARSATDEPSASPPAGISNNGQYVFFDSQAKLVSQADNHTLDVYEWEAPDTGGCALAAGCVHLLSSPNDSFPSFFLGYSPYEYEATAGKQECKENPGHRCEVVEGGNVFFGTHAGLVPQDTNSVGNIYDARICKHESLCIKPPPPPPLQCEGGTCQSPPTAPNDPAATLLAPPAPVSLALPPPVKPLTRAEKLANALRTCRKDRKKSKRVACEKQAKKTYGVAKKSSKSKRGGKS
jgi:hypothetical protein